MGSALWFTSSSAGKNSTRHRAGRLARGTPPLALWRTQPPPAQHSCTWAAMAPNWDCATRDGWRGPRSQMPISRKHVPTFSGIKGGGPGGGLGAS